MIRLAEAAGMDAGVALLDLNAWRTKSGPAQLVYERLRATLAKTAAALLVAAVMVAAPSPSKAADKIVSVENPRLHTLCAL
jgi:hypothetical protein